MEQHWSTIKISYFVKVIVSITNTKIFNDTNQLLLVSLTIHTQKRALRRSKEMIKARIKADDGTSNKRKSSKPRVKNKTKRKMGNKNLYLPFLHERERQNKATKRRTSDFPGSRAAVTRTLLSYGQITIFVDCASPGGLLKFPRQREENDSQGQRARRERRGTKFRRHFARGKNEEERSFSLFLSLSLGGFKGKALKRDASLCARRR